MSRIRLPVGISCFILTALIALLVRFSHPTMTETQLLLNFWYVWFVLAGLCIAGAVLTEK